MARPLGPSIAPIFLRIALGVTFLWAGIGKMEATMTVKGEQAATLATMGVERIRDEAPPRKTRRPTTPEPAPATTAPPESTETPINPATTVTPAPMGPPEPVPAPEAKPAAKPSEPTQSPNGPKPDAPPPDAPKPADPAPVPQPPRASGALAVPMLAQMTAPSISPGAGTPDPNRVYQAAEFPDEIEIPRVYGLALLLHKAANPPASADPASASQMMRLWPQSIGKGMWPVRLAWMVAITEVVAGLFVLVGLLTRASAIALAGTMLGAIWLTEIGPAMQAGSTVLGILPDRDPFSVDAWRPLLWQLSLFMGAMALVVLGSGALGFDRKLFPPPPPAPPPPRPMM